MSPLDITVALLRGVHVAALVSLFGTLVFLMFVAPSAMAEATIEAPRLRRVLLRLARVSAVLALIVGIAWLVMESAAIADADSIAMTLRTVPVVALHTQFGQWLLLRFALLLASVITTSAILDARVREHDEGFVDPVTLQHAPIRWRARIAIAAVLAAIALAIQPMLGHAGALGGSVGATLIVSEVMHLLAAGAWLGGLLPLFITVGALPHTAGATACRHFTPVGLSAVLVLGGTAVVQVAELMGGLPGLFGTGYGDVALVKLGLFVMLLTLAAINRLALTERLARTKADTARRAMRASVATEIVLGTLVVITAGFLASRTPGSHEQPIWPFAYRPSLFAFYDPDLRREVIAALLALGAAVVIAIVGMRWRKIRWPALGVTVLIVAFSLSHLDLLFVAAYPTSFFTSPTEFAATAIAHGAKLFAANCAVCHGAEGRGDGPAAQSIAIRPADLTAEHFWAHSDGELFWYISHGFEAPDGGIAMPGFAGTLSSEARWDLIDYLRAHNAGASMRATDKWTHPLPVPQFDVTCGNGRTIDLDDLRGRVLRIVAVTDGEALAPLPPVGTDIATIALLPEHTTHPDAPTCVAREPETWTAFAILSGVSGEALAGEQVLVDQNAWLRLAWRPGDPGDWSKPETLAALIRDITAHPIAVAATGGHVHRH